ncbi:MAG: NAD-dependent epimerase [Desulfohalobiaceae bacterium]
MKVLVTGAAGFIGFHFCLTLLRQGVEVLGLDNLNPYYSVELKKDRLKILQDFERFEFTQLALQDEQGLSRLFQEKSPTHVVNLAAQAGVRHSLTHPQEYIQGNMVGFGHLLECCRWHAVQHLVFASSSSVYGLNTKMPFSVHHNVDHPISLYAASKKSNELMAHCYSYLYQIPCTGLRFFTVYGPWGRPDMALFLFTQRILQDQPIPVYNYGRMKRDFTYIEDIVQGLLRVLYKIPEPNPHWSGEAPDPASSPAAYKLYNIGNNNSVELERFIQVLEQCLGKKAIKDYQPLQPGDVPNTYADVDDLHQDVGFRPSTSIEEGIARFWQWYKQYYQI